MFVLTLRTMSRSVTSSRKYGRAGIQSDPTNLNFTYEHHHAVIFSDSTTASQERNNEHDEANHNKYCWWNRMTSVISSQHSSKVSREPMPHSEAHPN